MTRRAETPPSDGMTVAAIKAVYGGYAWTYDFVFGRVFAPGRRAALQALELKGGEKVLEVGVGTGLSLAHYPKGVRITGIDLTPEMLAKARRRARGLDVELHVMDAQAMRFRSASFDAAVAMYVAPVAPDPLKLIKEMRRVVKPGGRIVLVNHFSRRGSWSERGETWLSPLSSRLGWRPLYYLEDFLKAARLKPLRMRRTGLLKLFTVMELRK